jgi:hypothetical protein
MQSYRYKEAQLEQNGKNYRNFSQYSWYLGQDLNPGPPKYRAGVKATVNYSQNCHYPCLHLTKFVLNLLHLNFQPVSI